MMDRPDLSKIETELCTLLEERLGVKSNSLDAGLRKAGRRLPARMRANGTLLSEALQKSSHPQLATQIDMPRIEKARAALKHHLEKIDRREMRIRSALRIGSGLAVSFLVLAGGLIVLLRLRGFV